MLSKLIVWINKWYLHVQDAELLTNYWLTKVQKWQSTRGNLDTIRRIKFMRLMVTRYLCGNPILTNSEGISSHADGLPKAFGPILPHIRSKDQNSLRFVLTLLNVSKTIKGQGLPDFKSIIVPPSLNLSEISDEEIDWVIQTFSLKFDQPSWTEPHISTKAGPNGQALISSIKDLQSLPSEVLQLIVKLGGDGLETYMNQIRQLVDFEKWNQTFSSVIRDTSLIRKISLVHDPEAKCRIIGVLDYWSQTVLKPLHDQLNSCLKVFKADCTFNQESFLSKLPPQGPYYSLDLSKATDSFSVEFQERVLARLTSPEYARSWRQLIAGQEFYVPWNGTTIKYECGQPMGAYSSWPMFTLCHHIIVQIAGLRAKHPGFHDYVLLGDDIVLTDEEVVKNYKILIKSVGGSFSEQKSHVSNDTYEFCKRWIHKGVEVTGAPLRAFMSREKYAFQTQHIVDHIERRWCDPSNSMISVAMLTEFFKILGHNGGISQHYASRGFDYYLLPKEKDTEAVRDEKLIQVLNRHYYDILGCNHMTHTSEFTRLFWYQTLCHMKNLVIERGVKSCFQRIQSFMTDNKLFAVLNPGIPQQEGYLTILPPIRVALQNVRELQLAYDRYVEQEWWTAEETLSSFMKKDIDLAFNPESAFQYRNHEMILVKQSKLVKQFTLWLNDYKASRNEALEREDHLELSLIHI